MHYFSFEVLKKKIRVHFQRIIKSFTQKIVTKLTKGIRDPEKTYSGSRGQKGTGSRIRNTGLSAPDVMDRIDLARKCRAPVPVLLFFHIQHIVISPIGGHAQKTCQGRRVGIGGGAQGGGGGTLYSIYPTPHYNTCTLNAKRGGRGKDF